MAVVQVVSLGMLGLAGASLVGLGARTRRHWDEPAGLSFSVLAFVTGVWGLGVLATYLVEQPGGGADAAFRVAWLLLGVFPFVWLVFVLEYLGRNEFVERPYLALLGALAALNVGYGYVMLVVEIEAPGDSMAMVLAALAYTVAFFGGVAIVVITSVFVLRAVYRHEYVDFGEGVSLVVPTVGLCLTIFLASAFVSDSSTIAPRSMTMPAFALAWTLGASGYLAAYARYDVFESMPATSTVGTEMAVAEMDDPMVVVDTDERILEANAAATTTFGVAAGGGETLPGEFGYAVDDLRLCEDVELPTVEEARLFEPAVSALADQRDRSLGHVVVFRDVTERRRREQRLTVLNRVLRHNLRNDMTAVLAYAELVAEGSDPETMADRIREGVTDVVAISEKAREVEQLMALDVDPEAVTPLGPTVDRVVENVDAAGDWTAVVDVDPDLTVQADGRILEPVLHNLVENAVEHNDTETPRVEIAASVRDDRVAVTVADDGPGLPAHERRAVERGEETPLEHGSGLGLWAVRWGVAMLGGTLEFAERDPRGTVVRVVLPATSAPVDAGGRGATAAPTDD